MLADAATSPLAGFRVLSIPVVPETSERSRLHIWVLVLLPVLTVLVLVLLFIGRRLRTLTVEAPREVAWWGNGPVLGTSVWPRDPAALESFVDELEDHGVYGVGRTLVVPATEAEREIACSFAMRLAEAPWLAAAILDVGARADRPSYDEVLVTPKPSAAAPHASPDLFVRPRRLSSQGFPSSHAGRVIKTPPPKSDSARPFSSRPPRKRTVIGLPAVQASDSAGMAPERTTSALPPDPATAQNESTSPPNRPEPFRRRRGARATVRMIVPVNDRGASAGSSAARDATADEDAFLLTRPVPVAGDDAPERVGRAVHVATETPNADASNAVMRAAVRLLGDDDADFTKLRRSDPPTARATDIVTGVALAWNGPLSGPVLRRAARLAHRVMVVVSSGMSVVDLARIQTRLGRKSGIGYVLVNVADAYIDLNDRVGPVEEFWQGHRDTEPEDSRRT
jgi:hypothetical protein